MSQRHPSGCPILASGRRLTHEGDTPQPTTQRLSALGYPSLAQAESDVPVTPLQPIADRPTISLREASAWLGIGKTTAYELAAAGQFPCPVIRAGKQYRVPSAPLLRLLGCEGASGTGDSAA